MTVTHRFCSVPFRFALLWTLLQSVLFFQAVPKADAELIPTHRRTEWQPGVLVGVPGGIDQYVTARTNLIDVTRSPFNADRTGVADARPAIQNAINAASAGDVVYLPAGTYRLNSSISLKSDITLRGDGESTVIMTYNAAGILITGDYGTLYNAPNNPLVTSGLSRGSTNVTLANTDDFPVGKLIEFRPQNPTNQFDTNIVVVHVSLADNYARQQKAIVTAKTATTLSFWPPLQDDFSQTPCRLGYGTAIRRVGVENLLINHTNSTKVEVVNLSDGYACWLKDVRIRWSRNYTLAIYDSLNCEVRRCYLDAQNRGSGSNGAGLLVQKSTGLLFEDNIIVTSYPSIEVNFGVSRSVFAYNYITNSDPATMGILMNHGPHNQFNLYEGNIYPNSQSDGYFGSCSHETIFRNWVYGVQGGQLTYTVALKRFSRSFNMVGNILNSPGIALPDDGTSFGKPNIGNNSDNGKTAPPWPHWGTAAGPTGFQELDTNVVASLIRVGNYSYFAGRIPVVESLGTNILPDSLYLASKPSWFKSLAWPPFDPRNPNPNPQAIPAGYRFVNSVDPPADLVDLVPPTAPTALTVTNNGAGQAILSWSASTDNKGVAEYRVERSNGSNSTNFIQVGTPKATNFLDTSLQAGMVYNYRVRAMDAAGNFGPYSAVATVTTASEPVANQPPTVALSSPASGSSVYAPQVVVLSASAADSDGSVTRVEFYEGINKIGEDTTSPYAVNWNASVPGDYLLTAVAHDNAGAVTLSASTQFKVVHPGISSAQRLPNGGFQISANGAVGRTNAIHVSSDLVTWTLLTNVVNTSGTFSVVDPEAAIVGRRFYRVWAESLFLSNVVGFAKVTVPPGYSIVVNQFIPATNTVPAVLKGVPGGTTLSKFRSVTGDFSINSFDPVFLEWLDPNQTFGNGETGFLLNPTTNTFTLTFEGQVPQGMLGTALPSGYSMVGSLLPQGGFIQSQLGFPGASGDTVFLYRNGRYRTSQYDPLLGGWDYEPNVNVGEGFFLFKMGATNWLRSFSAFN